MSRWPNRGLTPRTYDEMIKVAFHERWWRSSKLIRVNLDGSKLIVDTPDNDPKTEEYTLIQYNFSLFFGIAVQLYEATLISDDTPWDRFRREHPAGDDPALNPWSNTDPRLIPLQPRQGRPSCTDGRPCRGYGNRGTSRFIAPGGSQGLSPLAIDGRPSGAEMRNPPLRGSPEKLWSRPDRPGWDSGPGVEEVVRRAVLELEILEGAADAFETVANTVESIAVKEA